jgi:DNA-binding Lrp family transcriptional regulator
MQEELDILKVVENNPTISQRKISQETGISLGQVNFLIKKCVKKGLIKIEGQTPKSIRYNITPKGLAEKADLTAQYIKLSYGAVIKLTQVMREIEEKYLAEGKELYVTGEDDELMQIAKLALRPDSFIPKCGDNVVSLNTKDFVR